MKIAAKLNWVSSSFHLRYGCIYCEAAQLDTEVVNLAIKAAIKLGSVIELVGLELENWGEAGKCLFNNQYWMRWRLKRNEDATCLQSFYSKVWEKNLKSFGSVQICTTSLFVFMNNTGSTIYRWLMATKLLKPQNYFIFQKNRE